MREENITPDATAIVSWVENLEICHLLSLAWYIFKGLKRQQRPAYWGSLTVT